MKWQAWSKYTKRERKERRKKVIWVWHSKFAWTPKCVPEKKHDSIVVPCHWVWLERYERRKIREGVWTAWWEHRSYTGELSLRQLVRK